MVNTYRICKYVVCSFCNGSVTIANGKYGHFPHHRCFNKKVFMRVINKKCESKTFFNPKWATCQGLEDAGNIFDLVEVPRISSQRIWALLDLPQIRAINTIHEQDLYT